MRIELERRVNLGNYEHYTIKVSDEFDDWERGLVEVKRRIDSALKLLSSEWFSQKVTVER